MPANRDASSVAEELPRFSIVTPATKRHRPWPRRSTRSWPSRSAIGNAWWSDDGSTDDALLTATAYEQRDPRFRVIRQGNQGTAGAYNAGVSSAVGDFVVICFADDILLPEHLFRMSAFIDSEGGYGNTLLTGTTGGRGINGSCSTGSKIVRRSIRSS
jgi:cellulose synthase/poly-beta-1,6-N-acetylglucosamine synthase-like glycosyltransferase